MLLFIIEVGSSLLSSISY